MQSPKANQQYRKARARLISRGLTLRSWALQNGIKPSTVYSAMRRERHGKLSQSILEKLAA